MNFEKLCFLIENNFWVKQIVSNSITLLLDYSFKKLNERSEKGNLLWQLLHCLQEAHRRTCSQLNWEYTPDAYIEISKIILTKNINVCSEANLANIFSTAVGHPINSNDVECWLSNFTWELASNQHEQLRNFIELKLLFHKERLSHVQKCYLEKFQQISFSNDNDTWFLYQLYIPNKYNIYNDKYSRNDLVELVEAYIYGNVNQWLNEKGIDCSDEVNALFVFGHQCTGKSTLVSKIIYDHYFNNEMNIKPIYIVNFSDRSFKNNSLIPKDICEYLSIGIDCLANAILIIDGLDESEWSSAVASYKLERLINDLKAYECKLIVTSRPSYFCTVDLKNTLDIHLNPFSSEQATEWLKIYKQYESSCNIEDITQQIDSLLPDIRKVILIPYILYICVTNNIQFNQITEIARLYDILFSNNKAEFLTTPYNPTDRNVKSVLLEFEKIITEISKYILRAPNDVIPTFFIDKLLEKNTIDSNKITAEYLLYRKDNDNYAFMHNSIPSYFIARNLYNIFTSSCINKNYDKLFEELDYFRENDIIIHSSIIDFIEYFVRTNRSEETIPIIEFLKNFLSGQFNDKLVFKADIIKIHKYYYLYFINIVRLAFAYISQHLDPFESFDLFDLLSKEEKEQFILYTELGQGSLDCIRNCSFLNKNLDSISLQGVNLTGKLMRRTSMQHANFKGSDLSGAYFIDSDYSLSCFDYAICKNIDFTDSILFGCSFKNARLNGANFTNANLDHADLRGAQLNKCNFSGASLKGTKILAEQLRSLFDFDIDYIRKKQIEIYLDECLVPDELLESEYQKQRPVSYVLNIYGK